MTNPAIVLISADRADVLEEQFWRYTREYDVRVAPSARDAKLLVMEMRDEGILGRLARALLARLIFIQPDG